MLHNWIFAIRLNTLMLEQPKFIGFPYKQEKNFRNKWTNTSRPSTHYSLLIALLFFKKNYLFWILLVGFKK